MKKTITCVLASALLIFGCASQEKVASPVHEEKGYLFAYFIGNGEDGLHYAASYDGYKWERLNNGESYLPPKVGNSKLMRDPCIVRGPDGNYHMVWTSGWNEDNIGYASSTDLIHWSNQKEIPVMRNEKNSRNAWAPEVVYDEKKKLFFIYWSSTVSGKFTNTEGASEDKYNHRLYYTTTKNFIEFSPTKLFYDPGFSVIDATFLRFKGELSLLVKDETLHPTAKKYLLKANAKSFTGPFSTLSEPISPPGIWVEGPTAIQIGNAAVIYCDAYKSSHYGALRSLDLVHWNDITDQLNFPDEGSASRMRHGTVIEVPISDMKKLGFH